MKSNYSQRTQKIQLSRKAIGVDIKAWEAEEIKIDEKTGEVTFVKPDEALS